MPLFHFQSNQAICYTKTVKEIQQTVFEKAADSFKLSWFTLPDSFRIPQKPCQTALNFFGFLFTPVHRIYSVFFSLCEFYRSPRKISDFILVFVCCIELLLKLWEIGVKVFIKLDSQSRIISSNPDNANLQPFLLCGKGMIDLNQRHFERLTLNTVYFWPKKWAAISQFLKTKSDSNNRSCVSWSLFGWPDCHWGQKHCQRHNGPKGWVL